MPAYRGRTHDGASVAITLSPFALPALYRAKAAERRKFHSGEAKYPRLARLLILSAGIVGSWTLLLYLASLVP